MKRLLLSLNRQSGFSLSDCTGHFDLENRELAASRESAGMA
jgi:hypothetical protein